MKLVYKICCNELGPSIQTELVTKMATYGFHSNTKHFLIEIMALVMPEIINVKPSLGGTGQFF